MRILKIIGFSILAFACSEPPAPKLRLSNRRLADSIFKEEIKLLTEKQDSLCQDFESKHLDLVVDSILTIRRTKIKEQIKRSKKQQ